MLFPSMLFALLIVVTGAKFQKYLQPVQWHLPHRVLLYMIRFDIFSWPSVLTAGKYTLCRS